jgi:hypothetical protein
MYLYMLKTGNLLIDGVGNVKPDYTFIENRIDYWANKAETHLENTPKDDRPVEAYDHVELFELDQFDRCMDIINALTTEVNV